MPYIHIATNLPVPEHTAEAVKTQLGHAIEAIPGKSEPWLMVRVSADEPLWFAGSDAPAAIAQVNLYGSADASDYDTLTGRITDILDGLLSIDPARIYVQYTETEHWGWNGRNF